MREYVFAAEYERGADAVMDVFIDRPALIGTALNITISTAGVWRVDRVVGPDNARDAVEAVYTPTRQSVNECLGEHPDCTITAEYDVVSDGRNSRIIYTYSDGGTYCHSVPFFAARTFGNGLVFDAQRRGNVYEWRILVPGDPPIGDLFDQLRDGLPEGISLSLRQVGTPSAWGNPTASLTKLPPEQRRTLETAVQMGYYATPRDTSLGDIADELELPKSTLRYRLRRAESWLIETVVADHGMLDVPLDPQATDD